MKNIFRWNRNSLILCNEQEVVTVNETRMDPKHEIKPYLIELTFLVISTQLMLFPHPGRKCSTFNSLHIKVAYAIFFLNCCILTIRQGTALTWTYTLNDIWHPNAQRSCTGFQLRQSTRRFLKNPRPFLKSSSCSEGKTTSDF